MWSSRYVTKPLGNLYPTFLLKKTKNKNICLFVYKSSSQFLKAFPCSFFLCVSLRGEWSYSGITYVSSVSRKKVTWTVTIKLKWDKTSRRREECVWWQSLMKVMCLFLPFSLEASACERTVCASLWTPSAQKLTSLQAAHGLQIYPQHYNLSSSFLRGIKCHLLQLLHDISCITFCIGRSQPGLPSVSACLPVEPVLRVDSSL